MPDIANAGLFGAGATLPSGGGEIDPPILTGNYPGPTPGPSIAPNWNQWQNDYWTRIDPNMGYIDPSVTVYPANPADAPYPAPGTGAEDHQSFIRRILGATPQGRLGQFLRDRIAANQTKVNMQSNPGSLQGPPAVPPGGALFGFDPNSGGGGGTPRYNYGTGGVSPTPSTNPLYTTGGNWQSVSGAPQDIRFSQNSGTGNFTADQTAKNFELTGGGYAWKPNNPGASDRGHDRFFNTIMQVDPEGGFSEGAPRAVTSGSQALYQQALKAVPMGPDGFSATYVQKLNDWIAGKQPANVFNMLNPSPTMNTNISGPPRLPGA